MGEIRIFPPLFKWDTGRKIPKITVWVRSGKIERTTIPWVIEFPPPFLTLDFEEKRKD